MTDTDTEDVVARRIRTRAEAGAARPNPLARTGTPLDGTAPDSRERCAVVREATERLERWDDGWQGAMARLAAVENLNQQQEDDA
jgi:hypothetical protein